MPRLVKYAAAKFSSLTKLGGGITFKKKVVPYDPSSITLGLAACTFDGAKYTDADKCIRWSDVPEDQSAVDALVLGTQNPTEGLPALIHMATGWWPVVTVEGGWVTYDGGDWVVVVCVYQWMWDQPVGWQIRVYRRN